jgi:Zn-dependent peptidase ImmA (M78 family)
MPDTVRIGILDYEIRERKGLRQDADPKACGRFNYAEQAIDLETELPQPFKRVVLWHEIVHAILEQSGHCDYKHDESLCDALSYALVQILRDNPWLADFPEVKK